MSATGPFARILLERAALVVVAAGAEDELVVVVAVVAGEPDDGGRLRLEPPATEVSDEVTGTVAEVVKTVVEVVVEVVKPVADVVVETDVAGLVVVELPGAVVIGPGPRLNIEMKSFYPVNRPTSDLPYFRLC